MTTTMADDQNSSSNRYPAQPAVMNMCRRQTTSLVLPRATHPVGVDVLDNSGGGSKLPDASILARTPHGSSFSFWRPQRKTQRSDYVDDDRQEEFEFGNKVLKKKHGVKNWKALRAISHIRMRHISCLFSVETVAIRGLPTSTNGLRVAVMVRKEGSKDGAVQTLPCCVVDGHADFDETLYVKCHLYFTGGADSGKPVKFESKLFFISVVAIDAPQINFGNGMVNLSSLVLESVQSSLRGNRVRQWDKVIPLQGKAAGSELVVKLSFQIMQGGVGLGIFSNDSYEDGALPRKQTKSSFSVASRRVGRTESDLTHLRLDSPRLKPQIDTISEDFRFLEFDVVYKGTETSTNEELEDVQSKSSSLAGSPASSSSEVVKEVVNYRSRNDMLLELDLIDKEIKALESKMISRSPHATRVSERNLQMDALYSEEDNLTNEFLKMLEQKNQLLTPRTVKIEHERKVLIPDLGKGLGPVIQTRDRGFFISMNPFNTEVARGEAPKLVMQVSRPFILKTEKVSSGFEVFQRIAAIGSKELELKFLSWAGMDDLKGKYTEQVAYEGIASFIVHGRNKEAGGANSCAAQSIQIVKKMAQSMVEGRKQRILTGIWNVAEKDPSDVEEVLAFCIQKIESMAIDAMKIQARVSDEEAPFGISRLVENNANNCIFNALVPADQPDSYPTFGTKESRLIILYGVILRDPSRGYEMVGAPMIAAVQATRPIDGSLRVTNLHLGGLQSRLAGEKQRLTALHWLIANGFVRKRIERQLPVKGAESLVWSVSTRVVADMWLKTMRNPDVTVVNSN